MADETITKKRSKQGQRIPTTHPRGLLARNYDLTRTTGRRMVVQTSVRLGQIGERRRGPEFGHIVETLGEFRFQVDDKSLDMLRRSAAAVAVDRCRG